ncbi:hypothetical protein TrVFT333_010887 [Trichoderma virens FT-333]|nr:hypothetical protein TrVFT333_010887 [Trichoderma virens FT-333]
METCTGPSLVESALKELHAYAKLLYLRSGRQFEDKTSYQEPEDEASLDESGNEGDSFKNVPLGNLDEDLLRREFLDRLSETVSSEKRGPHVVASHMFYWPDKVKVFVAINLGFAKDDVLSSFLGNLCIVLKEIAAVPDNQAEKHENALWQMLLRHQSSRLNTAIGDVQKIMESSQWFLPQHSSLESTSDVVVVTDLDGFILDLGLKRLVKLLSSDADSDLERYDSLVSLSYVLHQDIPVERFQDLGPAGDKLHRAIGFLGRLKRSFQILVAAAKQILGFDDLSLIPVVTDRLKTGKKRSGQEWNLDQTLHALKLQLSNTEVDKLSTGFSRLKSPTWQVHAEIQLILFILSHPDQVANGKRFDYIGCSSWTLPPGDNLGEGGQHMLYGAVMEVISWMRKELIGSVMLSAQRRAEVKESTIGGSFIAIPGMSQENRQRSYAVSEYLHRQRAQNSHVQSNKESLSYPVEDEGASRIQARREVKSCERKMPLSHLLKCNMRQVTSADYLYEDALAEDIPTDPQVRQDYWFDRCQDKIEESHLGGLFAGLFKFHVHRITREELHEWRSHPDGNQYLVAKIVEKFEELPDNYRGGYFPWFLRNRTRFELDHSTVQAPCQRTQLRNREARARKYLAPKDRHKDIKDLTPFAKFHCFFFYLMALDNEHPPPLNREHCHWFDFGFVVSHDEHEESLLGAMYSTILFGSTAQEEYMQSLGSSTMAEQINEKDPICSFNEFWKAWERGELMTLFDKHWPDLKTKSTTTYNIFDRLRVFLEAKAPRPSIWRLRHFLAMEDVSVESAAPEIAWAARDYGFSEQLDTRTTIELKELYRQLFKKVEPLVIHHERMKGNLVQLAENHVDITAPRMKEVLEGLR